MEITRISENTKFGNTKLDGSYQNKSIQVGKILLILGYKHRWLLVVICTIRDDLHKEYILLHILLDKLRRLYKRPTKQNQANSIFIDGHLNNATIAIDAGMKASQFAQRVHAAGLGIEASAVTKAQLFGMALHLIFPLD